MHVLVVSLFVALAVCVLLLAAFGVFTATPFAHRIENEQRRRPQPH